MTEFLDQVARHIITRYGDDLPSLCIVLPNRRGGLFLRKNLSAQAGKDIWAPEIYSIEDFTARITGFRPADHTSLLFRLYEVHREITGRDAQPFGDFMSWAPQLLHDFNDIDSNLVDPAALFDHLSEARAISLWNLDARPLTDFQKQYLRFYRSLKDYYLLFTKRLVQSKLGYPGLILRRAAGEVLLPGFSIPWKRMVFAGFNALSKAEEDLFSALRESGKSEMLWDADHFYMDDPDQEAGDFLRKWHQKWGSAEFLWIGDHFPKAPAEITITGVPGNIGQVKFCGDLLKKIRQEEQQEGYCAEESAVILMDEQLLIPLLNSVPGTIGPMNITMGLPLKNSAWFNLFDSLLRMHVNLGKFQRAKEGGKPRFYLRDVLNLLRHPVIARITEPSPAAGSIRTEDILRRLANPGRSFLSKEEILEMVPALAVVEQIFPEVLFGDYSTPENAINRLKNLILVVRDSMIRERKTVGLANENTETDIRMEFLFCFSNLLFQLESVMKKYGQVSDLGTFHKLFHQLAASTSMPFYGEPLSGLQVMGMLETRTLDFKNLILLSVNDDLIPGSRTVHSFIPYDIRRSFHLPVYHHKNSVYAYHFYRLLQRAECVNIVYNTESGELGGGEKSRFIKQIISELPLRNPHVKIREQLLSIPPIPGDVPREISVEKSPGVMELLAEKAARGFSPTALNAYRKCPLLFYFTHVAGIRESTEGEEVIDPPTLGHAVHEVLQLLLEPFVGKTPLAEEIGDMIPLAPAMIRSALEKKFSSFDLAYGRNLLSVQVAVNMTQSFLAAEKQNLERYRSRASGWKIGGVERKVISPLIVPAGGIQTEVNLLGVIDRYDLFGHILRVIDYKTGVVEKNDLKLKSWEDLETDPGKEKLFQVLMYSYLLNRELNLPVSGIEAGIISLRRIRAGFIPVDVPGGNGEGDLTGSHAMEQFEQILVRLLSEIFDPSVPFTQTPDESLCLNCPWINLCGR